MELRIGSVVRVRAQTDAANVTCGEVGVVRSFVLDRDADDVSSSSTDDDCLVVVEMPRSSPARSVRISRDLLEAVPDEEADEGADLQPSVTRSGPVPAITTPEQQPAVTRCRAGVLPPGGAAVVENEEQDQCGPGAEDVCRFCLEAGEDEPLERACACRGSAAWVHAGCLRSWQQFVMVSTNNRPENVVNEQRHTRCSVCHEEFAANLQPPTRSDTLSDWARLKASDLTTGVLLRYASEYPVPDFEEDHECLRHIFEERKEHFRNSVYLITEHADSTEPSASRGEVEIKGVNLCRPAISRWDDVTLEQLSRGAISDEDVAQLRRSGIDVSVGLGGPQQSKSLSYGIVISAEQPNGYVVGEALEMRDLAVELNDSGRGPVELRLFLGHARWTGEQLLGEITRQSWGFMLEGTAADDLRQSRRKLWRLLEDQGRLTWAPENPLAEEYRSRLPAARGA